MPGASARQCDATREVGCLAMGVIEGATIKLKSGERIDAYIMVDGDLVPVHIETADPDATGASIEWPTEGGMLPLPVSSHVHIAPADPDATEASIESQEDGARVLIPGRTVKPVDYPGSGAGTAMVKESKTMFLYSDEFGIDISEMLRTAAGGGQDAGPGRIIIDSPLESEISFGLKDLGGARDG